MFLKVFGCVWTCLDAFGCNQMHFGALGSVPTLLEIFGFVKFSRTILAISGRFLALGAYFSRRFMCRELTYIGANYWEVALRIWIHGSAVGAAARALLELLLVLLLLLLLYVFTT